MSYFPPDMPRPEPNMDDQGFWQHCAGRKLAFQTCADCGAPRHPPTPVCWNCRSMRVRWTEVSGEAEVFSYTEIHHAVHEVVADRLPYAVVLLSFPDLPGPRLVSNLSEVPLSAIHIGMRVRLWWDDIGDGMYLPRFRPIDPPKEVE